MAKVCGNISKAGIKCFRIVKNTAPRCTLHEEIVCSICLTASPGMHLLECTHSFHLDCIRGMVNTACPMCRSPMINLPDDVSEAIYKNGIKYREEQIEVEEDEIFRMIRDEDLGDLSIPPHMEIVLAMEYLYRLGIPPSRIPRHVDLGMNPGSSLPDPGSLFQVTVGKIIETIQKEEVPAEEEDFPEDPDDSQSDEESDDNPFGFEGSSNPLNMNFAEMGSTLRTLNFTSQDPMMRSVRTFPFPNSIQDNFHMMFGTLRFLLGDEDDF